MAAIHAAAFAAARPWSMAEFADLLAQPGVFACGNARAFALTRVAADEAELLTIATDPAHRRTGLARALMRDALSGAARRGAARLFLEVAADNTAARALYIGCGFRTCGRRPRYYARAVGPAVDALVMERTIGPGSDDDSGDKSTSTAVKSG